MVKSVRPSVRLSVTHFILCSHHRIIMQFSGVITNDIRDVHAKGQGQRSNVKVMEAKTQLSHFRTITPVWIHIWWWNDAQSLMLLRRCTILFFGVIRKFQGHTAKKILDFDPNWAFPVFEFNNDYKIIHKAWGSIEDVPYCFSRSSVKFQGHTGQKITILTQIDRFPTVWVHRWLWNDAQSLT